MSIPLARLEYVLMPQVEKPKLDIFIALPRWEHALTAQEHDVKDCNCQRHPQKPIAEFIEPYNCQTSR